MLEVYAPNLTLGARVSAPARQHYRLTLAPYLGYRDSTYRTIDGLRDLGVKVDEYVDDAARSISADARIEAVYLVSPDSLTSARVESRLRGALGEPVEVCYAFASSGPMRRLYWPGNRGRGVLLLMVLRGATSTVNGSTAPGSGGVMFGASAPNETDIRRRPCGRA